MAILIGVQPGGKGNFAVCSVYWSGKLPAIVFQSRSYDGVDDVLNDILGVSNEWGSLTQVAVAAPLTWSGTRSGWRACDRALLKSKPGWAPESWLRAPTSLPGATTVQGPALVWGMAKEAKLGNLPAHGVVETHPRLCLAQVAGDMRADILGYRSRDISSAARRVHVQALLQRITAPGMLRVDAEPPRTPDELDAFVCAIVALGAAVPDSGMVLRTLAGGDIRPVGRRVVSILQAFP